MSASMYVDRQNACEQAQASESVDVATRDPLRGKARELSYEEGTALLSPNCLETSPPSTIPAQDRDFDPADDALLPPVSLAKPIESSVFKTQPLHRPLEDQERRESDSPARQPGCLAPGRQLRERCARPDEKGSGRVQGSPLLDSLRVKSAGTPRGVANSFQVLPPGSRSASGSPLRNRRR